MALSRFAAVLTVLGAILGIELVVVVMGRTASPTDVLGGLLVTVGGMAAALLVQALARRVLPRAPVVGTLIHTVVAGYTLFVVAGVDAPFGWLLGVLFGAAIGAVFPSLAFGPASGWAPVITAARIAAFVGGAVLFALGR